MKSLADASFFRAFDAVASAGNPGFKRAQWSFVGAEWRRERHSYAGPSHSFAMEVFDVAHAGRSAWRLIVVKENWWGTGNEAIKSTQWARPMLGRGADILIWLREQRRVTGDQ